MSNSNERIVEPTPRHLWIIGGIAVLWNAGGATDYVMTQTANESWMSAFTPEKLAFFYSIPSWALAAWAIAVWGGVLGSILLLFRRSMAVNVFLVSLLALVASIFHSYVLSNGMEVMGDAADLGFTATIFVISLGLYFYARELEQRKILV